VLATACNPDTLLGPSARLASATEVITTPGTPTGQARFTGRRHHDTADPDHATDDDWGYHDENDEATEGGWAR
jgi:hypothetical protein